VGGSCEVLTSSCTGHQQGELPGLSGHMSSSNCCSGGQGFPQQAQVQRQHRDLKVAMTTRCQLREQ